MFIYKLIGILLISSPITVVTSYNYFPYSYLGLTLYFLATIFSHKDFPPIIDLLFWIFCSLCIFTQKPISYQIGLALFMIYHYIVTYIYSQSKLTPVLIWLGIIFSVFSLVFTLQLPFLQIINSLLLILTMIINHKKNKKIKTQSPNFGSDTEEYNTILETLIPLKNIEDTESLIQELEYVIPLKDKE